MGELIVHVGGVGTGQQVKVLSNAVSAVNCATLAQALVVGRRADVNLEALLKVMAGGSANSTMLQLKGEPMLKHDFTPLFKLDHMLKDVRLCLEEARAAGAAFPAARSRASFTLPAQAAVSASRTSPPCWTSWRVSTTPLCDGVTQRTSPKEVEFAGEFWRFRDFVHSM